MCRTLLGVSTEFVLIGTVFLHESYESHEFRREDSKENNSIRASHESWRMIRMWLRLADVVCIRVIRGEHTLGRFYKLVLTEGSVSILLG